jgi:hypothetical protein
MFRISIGGKDTGKKLTRLGSLEPTTPFSPLKLGSRKLLKMNLEYKKHCRM